MAGKSKKSKFFRVATEGATTDGRKIERKWLEEIAATYSPEKYTARIFIEHIRGYNPNGDYAFRCMGDVLAVKTDESDDGKLQLYAQVSPTDEFVAMAGKGQKVFGSIEVAENFANSGMAYLFGLGVTDTPASLSTEMMTFASQNPAANPFSGRKQAPGNLFSAAEEITLEFEDVEDDKPSIFERVKEMFAAKRNTDGERFADVHLAMEAIADETTAQYQQIATALADVAALRIDFTTLKTGAEEQATTLAGLVEKIDHTAAVEPTRPKATGATGTVIATDC